MLKIVIWFIAATVILVIVDIHNVNKAEKVMTEVDRRIEAAIDSLQSLQTVEPDSFYLDMTIH